MYDLDQISALFNVVEKSQGHPKLKAIFDKAMAALEAHAAAISQRPPEEQEPQEPDGADGSVDDRRI